MKYNIQWYFVEIITIGVMEGQNIEIILMDKFIVSIKV